MIGRLKTTTSMLAWALVLLLAYSALAQPPAGATGNRAGDDSRTSRTQAISRPANLVDDAPPRGKGTTRFNAAGLTPLERLRRRPQ